MLRDLALVMIVAGVVTLVFHRMGQPVVLGYILAGVLLGPHAIPPGLITEQESIRTLADLGIILLMFTLGLQFNLRILRRIGSTAFIAASIEIMMMVWLGYHIGRLAGWSKMDAIFLGGMLSITSTTIIIKTLTELRLLKEPFARLITGISLVEDMLGITLTAVLSGIAMTGVLEWQTVGYTASRALIFLSTALVLGLLLVPPLFRYVSRFKSAETLLVTALGLCFGVSLLAWQLGFSVALGAFVIGVIIGETREAGQLNTLMEPLRDMFIAVFFVSVGLMINPRLLADYWLPTVLVSAAVVIGKMASFTFGTFIAGNDLRTALRVGTSLIPIGELSLIIAALGLSLGVTSEFLYPIAVCVSAVTTLLTPYLIRNADPMIGWFERALPAWLTQTLELYGRWLARMRQRTTTSQGRAVARRWALQIALNMMLVTAAFGIAVALGPWAEQRWPDLPGWMGGARGLLWLLAAVVALPGLIAAWRKLQALAMLLAELSTDNMAGRAVISQLVLIGGTVGLGLWVLLWSGTLLPAGPALGVLLLMVLGLAIVFWRSFIQLHARAQVALRETLTASAEPAEEDDAARVQRLFRDARLATVIITQSSPAANKLIRELELRSRTGATVVAIERGETSVINPGPDEELHPEDRLLLLGTPEQLRAAQAVLSASVSSRKVP
ncbi:MAG: cation:proton antiporter [Verrucomicrobiae bacterium]|nr:cation:proton antiporter [Verrucomicrobiae bacterium]